MKRGLARKEPAHHKQRAIVAFPRAAGLRARNQEQSGSALDHDAPGVASAGGPPRTMLNIELEAEETDNLILESGRAVLALASGREP